MGVAEKEWIEKRECAGCGELVNHRIIRALRGEHVVIHTREPHKAPCGRACYEGRDVSMRQVMEGNAHHPRRCECVKQGRGYG